MATLSRPTTVSPAPTQDLAIQAVNLGKKYGDQSVVTAVTFDIPRGNIFGFIGPSGAGKTTTVRMLTGVVKPTSGTVTVLGSPPGQFHTRTREKIGYMPQLFALYPDLTVWENLNFAASLYGMGLVRGKQLHRVLEFVELDSHRRKLARDISGGMQRRLSLAATLVHDPEVLFLDEPTMGIDPILRSKFWEHFDTLKSQGRTLFVTTQYVGEAAYCDLIGVLAEGHLLAVDTPAGLRRRAFGGEVVELHTPQRMDYNRLQLLRQLPFVHDITRLDDLDLRVVVDDASSAIPALLNWGQAQQVPIDSIREYLPPFDDVFVQVVKNAGADTQVLDDGRKGPS